MGFRLAITLATGLSKPHRINTGLVRLFRELSTQVASDVAIQLYRWHDYEKILCDLKRWEPKQIVMAGHSYGVSLSAFVCKKLKEDFPHIRIADFISADGVWRETVDRIDKDSLDDFDENGQPIRISIPNNVDRLHTWRQRKGPIRGHGFEIEPPTVWATDVLVDGIRHYAMDRNVEFLNLIKTLALA